MAENMWEKYRGDREKNLSKGPKHGKQTNQKLKPYVVLEYLMKYSDENNTKSAYDIIGYLENCGISAERRSIYRDIEDINRIMLMLQEDIDLDEVDMMFEEAEESGDEEEINALKTILYNKNKKGFYVRQRKFEVADMRLLAECVYAAKFIAEGQAKRLVDVICDFVSEEQAYKMRKHAQLGFAMVLIALSCYTFFNENDQITMFITASVVPSFLLFTSLYLLILDFSFVNCAKGEKESKLSDISVS